MTIAPRRLYTPLLVVVLGVCIVRFWLPLLSESFWIDETVTAFILRHGAMHPSLAAGPRLDQTIYYWLPCASAIVFGFSEWSLRLPSLLATFASLWMLSRLTARFVHPDASWFAVFLCFIPHEFTRQATDARPYGLGTFVALAAIWFLVRWLDLGCWADAAGFAVFAGLLVRVHLAYWPFYVVFIAYSLMRVIRRETEVQASALAMVFAVLGISVAPLVPLTFGLLSEAKAHIVVDPPTANSIISGLQIPVFLAVAAGAWLIARIFRWRGEGEAVPLSGVVLLGSWWLWQPCCLLAASWITGSPVFVPRYFSLALPGTMLASTMAAGHSLPARLWKPAAALLAGGILIVSLWRVPFLPTRNSEWREAAQTVNNLVRHSSIPVLCPSPFVEAQPPAWSPSYPLPGFLYAHLDAYPVHCDALLPARHSTEGDEFAGRLAMDRLVPAARFVIYGGTHGVSLWTDWFAGQSALAGRNNHQVGLFGDAEIVMFEPAGNQFHR